MNVHAHGEVTLSDSARYETGEQHGRCGELHCEEIGEGARGDEGCSMYVPEFDLYTIYLLRTRRSHHGLDGSKGKTSIPTRAGQWMIGRRPAGCSRRRSERSFEAACGRVDG